MRFCGFILFLFFQSVFAQAQSASPILQPGNAAVAGFSGAKLLDGPGPTGAQPFDKTFIDPDGPALRVIDLQRMGGPPQGQFVDAPKPFTVTARQIGQVFSVTLDDANPPNIYAAATSAYGLPIVVPDRDGDGRPDRARRGAPNAAFMPGLFGPVMLDGGPGSIWRIDGRTGAVSLFANVMLAGVPNSGPALGGLAFDPISRQIFGADRDTGMIHRFSLDGIDRGQFDHGRTGLSAAGLPPAPFDARKRLNVESPAFDATAPATWALAPPVRRVFGVAVRAGRLYYAVAAGLRVWSVAILPDRSFATDARVEVQIGPGPVPGTEISDITFDDEGRMLLAERGAPTGAYDFQALAQPGSARTFRLLPKPPGAAGTPFFWEPDGEYAIGFPPDFQNANGGVAIGYGYDSSGTLSPAICGGTVWATGEQLRLAADPVLAQRLAASGPFPVDGLQGQAIALVRPQNAPPFSSYFIDYDDRTDRAGLNGHLGDVAIWRVCQRAALQLPLVVACPVGLFNVDGVCQFPRACPPGTEFADGCCVYHGCPASYVRIRGRCVPPPLNCDSDNTYVEGRCEAPQCPSGLVVAKKGTAFSPYRPINECSDGQQKNDGVCPPPRGNVCGSPTYCGCPEGTRLREDGTCKQSNGCGVNMVLRGGECSCAPGYQKLPEADTCVPTSVCDLSLGSTTTAGCCPQGKHLSASRFQCEPDDPGKPDLKVEKVKGICGPKGPCVFHIHVTNVGSALYAGELVVSDEPKFGAITNMKVDPPGDSVVSAVYGGAAWWRCDVYPPSGSDHGGGRCGPQALSGPAIATLAPGESVDFTVTVTGGRGRNCTSIFVDRTKDTNASNEFACVDNSCSLGQIPMPNGECAGPVACPPTTTLINGTCCTPEAVAAGTCGGTTMSDCPSGTRRGFNGQCFVVDPGCRGPNCPPVTTGCRGGVARNSDGNCPTTTTGCTGGKILNDGVCRCPYGTTDNESGKCVRLGSSDSKKTKHQTPPRKPRPKPNSDNPGIHVSPQLNIGIGIGGGRPGGSRPPSGGGGKPSGSKG